MIGAFLRSVALIVSLGMLVASVAAVNGGNAIDAIYYMTVAIYFEVVRFGLARDE